MISILVPSRGRPDLLRRMAESARQTASGQIEVVARVDDDDFKLNEYRNLSQDCVVDDLIVSRRCTLSNMWNQCSVCALGDIQMLAGDDLLFQTSGWDKIVTDAFDLYPDRIVLVYGGDGYHTDDYATHPFLHRRWIDTIGRLTAPYFSSNYTDTWLWDVAGMVGRRQYVPILIEHLHYSLGKGTLDQTAQENIDRYNQDNPAALYVSKAAEREQEAEKLRKVMT